MLITDVTTIKLRYDMPVAMADAIHYMPNRPTLLVQVHTDEGIIGLGEAAVYGAFSKTLKRLSWANYARLSSARTPSK